MSGFPRALSLVILATLVGAASATAHAQRPSAATARQVSVTYPAYPGDSSGSPQRVGVVETDSAPGARRFEMSTTAPQRDGDPQRRIVRERAGEPYVESGSTLFDALFAMAVDDALQASVTQIRDDAYNGGQPIPCHCFETGEKWHYVWTRDLSYALDLGLAGFDPQRAVTGLLFKTSGFRPGVPVPPETPDSSEQIIQDTGSGGSWPVSTDRVAWALGAERTLATLHGAARARFARQAYRALRGTLEADRLAAFDPHVGLYGGEESFLDWREQTYPAWIVDDLPAMAQSKALSTNVLHYRAMRLAARLAREFGARDVAARYTGWADALAVAINREFWVPSAGLYATYTTADRNPAVIEKYDLLGNDLAIVSGIADLARARSILSRYPFAPFGPPVVWPEAPDMFVYHNRAIWPFVTAYTLRAAAHAGHVAAADRAFASLMRGAALHLSNMENLEWLTGESQFDDGPAINSRRQLWSIAAYYGSVVGTIFGWHVELDGVHVAPFLTTQTRALFGTADSARLGGLRYQGKPVEIVLDLPAAAPAGGVYTVRDVRLNGRRITTPFTAAELQDDANRVEIRFGAAHVVRDAVTGVPIVRARSHDDPRVFMPRTPTAVATRTPADSISLAITEPAVPARVTFRVLRDGERVARGISAPSWTDPAPAPASQSVCYSVVAVYTTTKLASEPSAPSCLRGRRAQTIAVTDPRVSGAPLLPAGDSVDVPTRTVGIGTRLIVSGVKIAHAGVYAIATRYDNHVFALNTGVTNAVKRMTISGAGMRARAVVQMPHIRSVGAVHPIRQSTRVYVHLVPGTYTIELSDFFNMSALEANARYTGPGGSSGPVNEARVAAVTLDEVSGAER